MSARLVSLALLSLCVARIARADISDEPATDIPAFVDKLPERVQNVVENMAQSRDPASRFLFSVLDVPRSRLGSGTSWLPDDAPQYAVLPHTGNWGFLLSGNIYTGYVYFNSKRGDHRFLGRNVLMFSAFRAFRKSELMGRALISFEPFTVGSRGYPLIAQTGNTSEGLPLHDRQHAFELFRELALVFSHEVTARWALTLYVAASGEPALGPGAFTHRVSANPDPLAPLGFQWQDGTQTSFGVLTFGAFRRDLKVEASWFNGLEAGERRYGVDLVRMPDSGSARITWQPFSRWSLQTSYGFLRRPLRLAPNVSHHRLLASASYATFAGKPAGYAATLSLAERITSIGDASLSALLEAYWSYDGHHSAFGRAEIVQKSGIELVLPQGTRETHPVGTLLAGYIYYFGPLISLEPGLGFCASVTPLARELRDDYGTRAPVGFMVYAQLRTAALPTEAPLPADVPK